MDKLNDNPFCIVTFNLGDLEEKKIVIISFSLKKRGKIFKIVVTKRRIFLQLGG